MERAPDRIRRSPLDAWIAREVAAGGGPSLREHIERHQLRRLRETLSWARARSPFYRRALAGAGGELAALGDLERLPFTTADDLREQGLQFLCVSQGEISRVVTLSTSGTTGRPKRLYFTAEDQERAVDFMRQGASDQVRAGDRVIVLVPGEPPGSAGALLGEAFRRLGATPVVLGLPRDLAGAIAVMRRERPAVLVGVPTHALALARQAEEERAGAPIQLRSVFLIGDHVSDSIVRALERAWGCEVFEHYGLTETALGGGVDCEAHSGYHLREADLFVEVIDPVAGRCVPDGTPGEIVVTTLSRRGMPLIRYRTGDLSRFLPGPCACGTELRRLERIRGRTGEAVVPCGAGRAAPAVADLDEALFEIPALIDFEAAVARTERGASLAVRVWSVRPDHRDLERAALEALDAVPAIAAARSAGELTLTVDGAFAAGELPRGPEKRAIKAHSSEAAAGGASGAPLAPAR
jgi:phenylacetate-CoA ligase